MNTASSELGLTATIAAQAEISRNLKPAPLKNILDAQAYGLLRSDDKASTKVESTGLADYFHPDVKNRRYYKDGEVVLAREEIEDPTLKSKGVGIVAEFAPEQTLEVKIYGQTVETRKIKYLPLKHLCLVKKDGSDEAIDLVAAWQRGADSKVRPIGLIAQAEAEEAVMGRQAIFFKDVARRQEWHMLKAVGSETSGTDLPAHFAAILSGAKATQEIRDLPKGLRFDVMWEYVTQRMGGSFSQLFRQGLFLPWMSGPHKMAEASLKRFERNALAATLYFLWQVRSQGFMMLPELTNRDLINLKNQVLQALGAQYNLNFFSNDYQKALWESSPNRLRN